MTSTAQTRLIVAGLFLLSLHDGIAVLSRAFIYGQGHSQRPILLFLVLYASAFTVYAWTVSGLLRNVLQGASLPPPSITFKEPRPSPLTFILGFALLFRAILLFSNPIQEDDFYRYLWDGKVVASGLNPYGVAPSAVEEKKEGTQQYVAITERDEVFTLILARVNHPWAPTIYPPLAQGIFGIAALVAPGSLIGLRILFLAFDLSCCLLIISLLRRSNLPACLVVVYAWSPLVVKEIMNSAHYDVAPTFFLLLALVALLHRWWKSAFVSLALAALGKLYPLLLVPLFLWRMKASAGWSRAVGGVVILSAVILAGYAPFLGAGAGLWQGTVMFAEQWQTNSFLFPLLALLAWDRWAANGVVGVLLIVTLFIVPRRHDLTDDRSFLWGNFVVLGVLFLLSPVGDPWYFVWLTPFLCFFPAPSWILLSGLLGLYYMSFYFMYHDMKETFRWIVWLEYLPFYGLLIQEWCSARSARESLSPAE